MDVEKKYPLTDRVTDGYDVTKLKNEQLEAYMSEQKDLRKQINDRAASVGRRPVFTNDVTDFCAFHIIKAGDSFRMVKREKQIDIFDFENGVRVGAAQTRTIGDAYGLSRMTGKYRDGYKLAIAEAASIEHQELDGNGGGGWN